MKKIVLSTIIILLLSMGLVSAHGHNAEGTKELLDSNSSCDELTDEQLETIGDYYMEQMHPGEQHERMDQMMGGEGSENLKQMHIQMAKVLYCKESGKMMEGNMMGNKDMMGSGGMMNMMGSGGMINMMGSGIMGSPLGGSLWWLWGIVGMVFWIALLVVLVLLIIWLYKKAIGQTSDDGSALDILKKRFAKGEITKKEFESMKKGIN